MNNTTFTGLLCIKIMKRIGNPSCLTGAITMSAIDLRSFSPFVGIDHYVLHLLSTLFQQSPTPEMNFIHIIVMQLFQLDLNLISSANTGYQMVLVGSGRKLFGPRCMPRNNEKHTTKQHEDS